MTALLAAARNVAPDARSVASGPGVTSAATTAERDQARPEGERPRAEGAPTAVGEAEATNAAAVDAAGAAGTAGRQEAAAPAANDPARAILSENVEHLSRDDVEGDDLEGTTGGTVQTVTGGAQGGEPGR